MKKIVIVSGFSGVGKDTLIREVLKKNRGIALVKSCTTRAPRVDDKGKYTYLSKVDFEQLIKEGGFLEYNIYADKYYGTPFEGPEGVKAALDKADTILIEVDYNGMKKICTSGYFDDKEKYDVVTVFIAAPADTLAIRLLERKTETLEQIRRRMEAALSEVTHIKEYDQIVMNDELFEFAVKDLEAVIRGEDIEPPVFFEGFFEEFFEKGIALD